MKKRKKKKSCIPVAAVVSEHGDKDIVKLNPSRAWEAVSDVCPDHIEVTLSWMLDGRDEDEALVAF